MFSENQFVQKGAARKYKPTPAYNQYNSEKSKDYILKRTDMIVPQLSRQLPRESQVINHDYPYSEVNTDPSESKRKLVSKRMREQIPLAKIKGREDNLMYRINDGYNLEDGDGKTFFDKFNVLELLNMSGKSP